MIIILKIQYSTPENSEVLVDIQDSPQMTVPWPTQNSWISNDIDAWLAEGNEIDPYDPYLGLTLEKAYATKEQETEDYAQSRIDDAYKTPQQGVSYSNPKFWERRQNSRRKDKADKQAGELPLDQAEIDTAKIDQKLSEFEGKTWADSDKVISNIHKKGTVEEVMVIDIETNITWNTWEPPV